MPSEYSHDRNFGRVMIDIDKEDSKSCIFIQVGLKNDAPAKSYSYLTRKLQDFKRIRKVKINFNSQWGDLITLNEICTILTAHDKDIEVFFKDSTRASTSAKTAFFRLDVKDFDEWDFDDMRFTKECHYDFKLLVIMNTKEDIPKLKEILKELEINNKQHGKVFLAPRRWTERETVVREIALKNGYGYSEDYKRFYFQYYRTRNGADF